MRGIGETVRPDASGPDGTANDAPVPASDFGKALDHRAVSTGASVSGYDSLVREFAIDNPDLAAGRTEIEESAFRIP